MVDDESLRHARERPEAKKALNSFAGLITESFVKSLPEDLAAAFIPWLNTAEGEAEFRELWPKIVDDYFQGLCNPKR